PVSGIAGYSVTTDGSEPDGTIDTRDGAYALEQLPEGATTIRARAISGAGILSAEVGETRLGVDRTPPRADVAGTPEPSVWQREPVRLRVTGTDQPGLSGMTPAPDGQPVEAGGHVVYRVDGGELQRVRGAAGDIGVGADGQHAVTFAAGDAAGNSSPEETVRF